MEGVIASRIVVSKSSGMYSGIEAKGRLFYGIAGVVKGSKYLPFCNPVYHTSNLTSADFLATMLCMICTIEGCEKLAHVGEICHMHRSRFWRHGSYDAPKKKPKNTSCKSCGAKTKIGRTLCNKCYYLQRKESNNETCSIEGCENKSYIVGGVCNAHYLRFQRHGTYEKYPDRYCENCGDYSKRLRKNLCSRCYTRMRNGVPMDKPSHDRSHPPEAWLEWIYKNCEWDGECRVWQMGGCNGYGTIVINGKSRRVHRVVFFFENGLDLDDFGEYDVHHEKCKNKKCCNVEHLKFMHRSDHSRIHGTETFKKYYEGVAASGLKPPRKAKQGSDLTCVALPSKEV